MWHTGSSLRHAGSLLWCLGSRVHGLRSCDVRVPGRVGSVVCGTRALVVAHGLNCPLACGILVP